jgi:hypothetical protein
MLTSVKVLEEGKKKNAPILLLTAGDTRSILLSGRNLPYLTISPIHMMNPYMILTHQFVLFMRDALVFLKQPKRPKESTKKIVQKATHKPSKKQPKNKLMKKPKKTTKSKKA